MKITATIITLNEERNIARAIESLRCCDEIVVVDSGSVDRTVELASNLGARILESPWHGYATQKNPGGQKGRDGLDLSPGRRQGLSGSPEGEILALKKKGANLRRLHRAAPGTIPGTVDTAQRLVSRPQDP